MWPQKVGMEPAVSGRYEKAGFRAMEPTEPTTVNAVIGTPPGSFHWPVPISQPRSVGCALCTAAHFAPVIALDREVMPQPPELPSANDQVLEQPTLWYHLHSRAPGGIRLQWGTSCNSIPAQQFPLPTHSLPSASEASLVNRSIQNPCLRLYL